MVYLESISTKIQISTCSKFLWNPEKNSYQSNDEFHKCPLMLHNYIYFSTVYLLSPGKLNIFCFFLHFLSMWFSYQHLIWHNNLSIFLCVRFRYLTSVYIFPFLRFGSKALRMFKVILAKKHVEQKQVRSYPVCQNQVKLCLMSKINSFWWIHLHTKFIYYTFNPL